MGGWLLPLSPPFRSSLPPAVLPFCATTLPEPFFFDTTLPPTSPPCVLSVAASAAACLLACVACLLLLAAPLSHLLALPLPPLALSRSPHLSCVCACWGFLLFVATLSLLPPTLTATTSVTHPPQNPNAAVIALPTFVASRVCLFFLCLLSSRESGLVYCSVRIGR